MVRIELAYNPFTVETTVVYDGTEQVAGMDLYVRRGNRLQNWIDVFIESLPGKVNDKHIELVFRGTCIDSEDVKQCVESVSKMDETVKIAFDNTQAVAVSPAEKLKALKALVQKARRTSPFDCFKNDAAFLKRIDCALAPEFEVNVVATMSSGKSTLINSLIGRNLMPAKSNPTTAKIAKIKDCDQRESFRGRVADNAGNWKKWKPATDALIDTWNNDKKVAEIELEGDIQAVNQGEDVRLVLVDTPGPNNSQNDEHRRITFDAVRSQSLSMVLYVLNAAQSATVDDKSLLEVVRDALKEGGRQAHERFIFVVNKVDDIRLDEGETPAKKLQEQRDYLRCNGIDNAAMLPLSARLALLVRMQRNGGFAGEYAEDLEDELRPLVRRFNRKKEFDLIELSRPVLGVHMYEQMMKRLNAEESDEGKAELKSGVPSLEALLLRYISKYAIPMKIKDAVDVLERIVREAANEQELRKVLAEARKKASKIKKELDLLEEDKNRKKLAQEFKDKIESKQYIKSQKTKTIERQLHGELNTFFSEHESCFTGERTPLEAGETLREFEQQAAAKCEKFESVLNRQHKNECRSQLETLCALYEKLVEEVVGRALPPDSQLKKLAKVSMTIPSTEELIHRSKFQNTKKSGRKYAGKLRNWRTWLKWEDTYTTQEYVHLAKAFSLFTVALRKALEHAFEELDQVMAAGFADAKHVIAENMQDVEKLMAETLSKIRAVTTDKAELEKAVQTSEAKLKWYENFNRDLQDILAVEEQVKRGQA